MIIHILGKSYEYKNETATFDQMLEEINELLSSNDVFIRYMNIDETEVSDNFYEYILGNMEEIQEITIEVTTAKHIVYEALLSTKQYLLRAIPELKPLASEFYANKNAETWEKFEQLLEGLSWINQVLCTVEQQKSQNHSWGNYVVYLQELIQISENLDEAVKGEDFILLADIIQYEVSELYANLTKEIEQTLDSEVVVDGIN